MVQKGGEEGRATKLHSNAKTLPLLLQRIPAGGKLQPYTLSPKPTNYSHEASCV